MHVPLAALAILRLGGVLLSTTAASLDRCRLLPMPAPAPVARAGVSTGGGRGERRSDDRPAPLLLVTFCDCGVLPRHERPSESHPRSHSSCTCGCPELVLANRSVCTLARMEVFTQEYSTGGVLCARTKERSVATPGRLRARTNRSRAGRSPGLCTCSDVTHECMSLLRTYIRIGRPIFLRCGGKIGRESLNKPFLHKSDTEQVLLEYQTTPLCTCGQGVTEWAGKWRVAWSNKQIDPKTQQVAVA